MIVIFQILEINFNSNTIGWAVAGGILLLLYSVANKSKNEDMNNGSGGTGYKMYTREDIFQPQSNFKSQDQYRKSKEVKKHGFPALISFFVPGLGQIIKGQFLKGIFIWLIGGIAIFVFSVTIILIPFAFIIWVWNVYDAYNSN